MLISSFQNLYTRLAPNTTKKLNSLFRLGTEKRPHGLFRGRRTLVRYVWYVHSLFIFYGRIIIHSSSSCQVFHKHIFLFFRWNFLVIVIPHRNTSFFLCYQSLSPFVFSAKFKFRRKNFIFCRIFAPALPLYPGRSGDVFRRKDSVKRAQPFSREQWITRKMLLYEYSFFYTSIFCRFLLVICYIPPN